MAKKPTVYVDTNVFSLVFYDGVDLRTQTKKVVTKDWWMQESRFFDIFTSRFAEYELEDGAWRGQEDSPAALSATTLCPTHNCGRDVSAIVD